MVRRFVLTLTAVFVLASPLTPPSVLAQRLDSTEQKKECVVYITRTGKRYHKEYCSSLRYSRIPMSREEAVKRGYTPCRRCGGSNCEK